MILLKVKAFTLTMIITCMFAFTATKTAASYPRIYSLSLNANDYWMIPDCTAFLSNPACIGLYPQLLELTPAEYAGDPAPIGTLLLKPDERITLGLTFGSPHPSFYNAYCLINPGETYEDYDSEVDILDSSDKLIVPEANCLTSPLLIQLAYEFDGMILGASASYTVLNSRDLTENQPPGTMEVKTTMHKDLLLNLGILADDKGPFETLSFSFSADYPSMSRTYALVSADASDIRAVSGDKAWAYKLGFAGTIRTSDVNRLIPSFNYSAANFHCDALEYRDNNNDGDFIDPGEEKTDDHFLAQRYSIKYGLADRLTLSNNGLIFIGVYGHIYKFKQYAVGTDTNGNVYDASIFKSNRFTVPLIIGGELSLTKWLVLRMSGTTNIVSFTKWYDETTGVTYTDFTSSEGNSFINAGIGLKLKNLTVDGQFFTPWNGNNDPSASGFNDNVTARLSVTWQF